MTAALAIFEAYEPTESDRLWLSRAVAAEGGDPSRTSQVMVHRFRFFRDTSPYWEDKALAQFVQSFAQPVNPRWLEHGDLAEKHEGTYHTTPEAFARRVHARKRTSFPPQVEDAVDDALYILRTGAPPTSIPWQAIDYAAPSVERGPLARGLIPLERATAGRNRLWTSEGGLHWMREKCRLRG